MLAPIAIESPFSEDILWMHRPKKSKVLNIEPYDGTTDPEDHVDLFSAHMYMQNMSDAFWCLYFPFTLKGVALC